MTHGDDNGLRMPPLLAPIEVVIVPIWRSDEERATRARGGRPHRARRSASGSGASRRAARARRRARRHEARREVLRVGAARRSAAPRARPARPRQEPGVLVRRDTREKQPVVARRARRGGRASCSSDDSGRHARRGARAPRGEQHRGAITYDRFRELMEGDGGVRLRRLVRRARECEAQVKEETKATIRVLPGRGVPVGRSADDVPGAGEPATARGAVGEGVLTRAGVRARATARCAARACALDRDRRARSARRPTSTAPATIREQYARLDARARAACRTAFTTALKANSNLAHPARCCASSAPASTSCPAASCIARCAPASRRRDIVFSGVGKTRARARARRSTPACCWSTSSRRPSCGCSTRLARERGDGRAGRAARESGGHGRDAARVHPDGREGAQVRHPVRRGARRRARRARRCRTSQLRRARHAHRLAARRGSSRIGTASTRVLELLAQLRADGATDAPVPRHRRRARGARTTPRSRPTSSGSREIVVPAVAVDRARADRRAGPLPRRQRRRAAHARAVPQAQRRQGATSSPTPG